MADKRASERSRTYVNETKTETTEQRVLRWGSMCRADGPVWHFDDAGGNWIELHHLGEDRAVLTGHDHEYSGIREGWAHTAGWR
jgi:hypothetical protein